MEPQRSFLAMVLRAAIWRRTPNPARVGVLTLLASCVALFAVKLILQYFEAGDARGFTPYGLSPLVAASTLSCALGALVLEARLRATVLAAIMLLAIPTHVIENSLAMWAQRNPADPANTSLWVTDPLVAFFPFYFVWWLGAVSAVVRSLTPDIRFLAVPRAFALWSAFVVALLVVPHYPAFVGPDFDRSTANAWEYARGLITHNDKREQAELPRVDTAAVEIAQPVLMDTALSRLAGPRKGVTDFYAIGIAGWADEDVFKRELEGGLDALDNALPIAGRTLRLINHRDTVRETPVANRQNLATAVRSISRMMDKDDDVLVLFVTSHGSPRGVALALDNAIYTTLKPKDVAEILDQEGIKNRIIIVSACYAGIFIKSLADENTIVITAADEDSPSFGCSNEREWTYFGDAFFNQGLRSTKNLKAAFDGARDRVAEWESRDQLEASNPQAYFGKALMKKLERLHFAAAGGAQH